MTQAFCGISWNVRISLWFIQKKGGFAPSFWCRSSIFLLNAQEHEKAQNAAVASSIFGLDDLNAEERYALEPVDVDSP